MKQSIFRRTLLLFLCAALLMSLFGAAFAAENTQTQFFYFSASKESGVIVPPEKLMPQLAALNAEGFQSVVSVSARTGVSPRSRSCPASRPAFR